MTYRRCRSSIVALSIGLVSCVVAGYWAPAHGQSVEGASKEVGPYDPIGAGMGSFVIYPSVDLEVEQNDNIFALPQDEVSDVITHLKPGIEALSNWNRHALVFNLDGDFAYYQDESTEDYDDWTMGANGRVDVQRGDYITLGANYAQLHEDRSSRNDAGSVTPTTYNATTANLGYLHTFNRLSVDLSTDIEQRDYDNGVDAMGALVDNQDRNRDTDTVTLRTAYQYRDDRKVFVEYARDNIDYDQRIDEEGNLRSSDGYRVNAGLEFGLTKVIEGEVSVGFFSRDFDDPAFESIDSEPAVGVDLTWNPSRLTEVTATVSRGVEESIEADESSSISTRVGLGVSREVRRNLTLNLTAGYAENEYQRVEPAETQTDDTVSFGLGFTYSLNRNYSITGYYSHEKRSSDVFEDEYSRNIIGIGVGAAY